MWLARWEHEQSLEAVQRRLDEHPFGTIKARMGATHVLMKTLRSGQRISNRDSAGGEAERAPGGTVASRKVLAYLYVRRPCRR